MRKQSTPLWAAIGLASTLFFNTEQVLATDTLFVPMGGEGTILAIDTSEPKIAYKISGLTAVHGLAGKPGAGILIAGSYQELAGGEAMPAKPKGMADDDHAAHHAPSAPSNGHAETGASLLTVISTTDRRILRHIEVSGPVHHVAVSPDGRWAAVTHPNAGAVTLVDLGDYSIRTTIKTGEFPNYVEFTSDNARAIVSNAGDDEIAEIDLAANRVTRRLTVGESPEHLAFTPDRETLFVSNVGDGTVTKVNVSDWRVTGIYPVGDTPHGIGVSDDGRSVFVSVMGEDRVVALDAATGDRLNSFSGRGAMTTRTMKGTIKRP